MSDQPTLKEKLKSIKDDVKSKTEAVKETYKNGGWDTKLAIIGAATGAVAGFREGARMESGAFSIVNGVFVGLTYAVYGGVLGYGGGSYIELHSTRQKAD